MRFVAQVDPFFAGKKVPRFGWFDAYGGQDDSDRGQHVGDDVGLDERAVIDVVFRRHVIEDLRPLTADSETATEAPRRLGVTLSQSAC